MQQVNPSSNFRRSAVFLGHARLVLLITSGTMTCLALTLLTALPACTPSAPFDGPDDTDDPGPGGDICEDDSLEDNDTMENARAGFQIARDFPHVACPGDEDWFHVTVQPLWYAELDFSWDPSLGELDLRIYAEDGTSESLSNEGIPGIGDGSWSPYWGNCPNEEKGIEYLGPSDPVTGYFRIVNLGEEPVPYEFFAQSMWACDE